MYQDKPSRHPQSHALLDTCFFLVGWLVSIFFQRIPQASIVVERSVKFDGLRYEDDELLRLDRLEAPMIKVCESLEPLPKPTVYKNSSKTKKNENINHQILQDFISEKEKGL